MQGSLLPYVSRGLTTTFYLVTEEQFVMRMKNDEHLKVLSIAFTEVLGLSVEVQVMSEAQASKLAHDEALRAAIEYLT